MQQLFIKVRLKPIWVSLQLHSFNNQHLYYFYKDCGTLVADTCAWLSNYLTVKDDSVVCSMVIVLPMQTPGSLGAISPMGQIAWPLSRLELEQVTHSKMTRADGEAPWAVVCITNPRPHRNSEKTDWLRCWPVTQWRSLFIWRAQWPHVQSADIMVVWSAPGKC